MPEIASRRHLELVGPVIEAALADAAVDARRHHAVAVDAGSGLIGALLVGVSAGKAIAWSQPLPFVAGRPPARPRRGAVPRAARPRAAVPVPARVRRAHAVPGRALARRARVLGGTLDDAAGEAFDKGARLLGLAYPGGPALEALAREGDPLRLRVPRRARPGCDLSFSGLKTALPARCRAGGASADARRADLAAGYQDAIVRRSSSAHRGAGRDALAVVRRRRGELGAPRRPICATRALLSHRPRCASTTPR